MPIRPVLLLLRLVLKISLLGGYASTSALTCGDEASSEPVPSRPPSALEDAWTTEASLSMFMKLSSSQLSVSIPTDGYSKPPLALERLIVGVLVLLLA